MQSKANTGSLADKFDGFGAAPSDALWGQIENALGQEEKKRRGIIWWWIGGASAAAIALIIALSVTSTNNPQNDAGSTIVTNVEDGQDANNDTHQHSNNEGLNVDDSNELADSDTENNMITEDDVEYESNQFEHQDQEFDTNDRINLNNQSDQDQIVEQNNDEKINSDLDQQRRKRELTEEILKISKSEIVSLIPDCDYPTFGDDLIQIAEPFKRPWEISVGMTYWTEPDFFVGKKEETLAYDPGLGQTVPTNQTNTDQSYGSGLMSISESETTTNNLYSADVQKNWNFNFAIGKYINQRWSWKTGIDISRTTYISNYTVENGFVSLGVTPVNSTTHITSIAIPISLQCDVVQRPKYRLRPVLSFVNEFPIYQSTSQSEASVMSESVSTVKGYSAGFQLGLSNDFRVGKRTFLSVSPSYRMYSTQYINTSVPLVKQYHWLGISAGLTWQL